jgi:hypothetical protein
VWLPVAIAATVFLLAGRPTVDAVILAEVGGGASVVVLATLSSRVREIAGSQWAPAISWGILCAAAWPVALFVPRAIVLPICAVLSAVLFWNIWRQLPPAFEVLPVKLGPQVSTHGRNAAVPAFAWWPILRSLFQPGTLLFLPLLVFLPAGGQWMYVCVFCVMPMLASVVHVSWALNLPVRRGALLAAVVLPWATLLLIGVLLSNWFAPKPSIRLKWAASHQVAEVRPPLEFWRAGKAPVIAAPWGESWQPETVRLRGVAVYNPYSVGAGNSVRFFEWQFRRATEAVYGEPIDYAEYQRHRPTVRPLTRQARVAILNLSACAAYVMLLVNIVLATLHWRGRRVFKWNVLGYLFAAQMACAFLIDWAPGSSWAGPNISASMMNALLLRVSGVLPAALPAMALAAALPVALLWWTASRLFRGVEVPLPVAVART